MKTVTVSLRQPGPIALDVEFACASGEMTALVGPSGSGKSTILRCIAGLYRPEHGHIVVNHTPWLDTEIATNVPTWRRRVGLVAQSYALFPHLSARANIQAALDGTSPGTTGPDQRADDLLALVNLAGLGDRRPHELSGGQQQRVAVARALAREPDILLLDEPFSAVDKITRNRLYEELASIRERLKMPIILVTHDLDEALMLADHICLIQRGRILQRGSPLDVVNRPASVDAARLVGHRNIFPGLIKRHTTDPARTILEWRGRELEAHAQPDFAPGTEVSWLIPQSKIMLHRRDRPSKGEAENPVAGSVVRLVPLGDTLAATIALDGGETRHLTLSIPRHVAERNAVSLNARVGLSLIADAIHIMPKAAPRH